MNPLQPLINFTGAIRSLRLWNGRKFAPFNGSNLFSTAKHNEFVALANCFFNPSVNGLKGVRITINDTGWALEFDSTFLSTLGVTPGTGSGGFTRYTVISHGTIAAGKADYVLARQTSNPAAGAVYILKPPLLRFSVLSRAAYSGITYSSYNDQTQGRVATSTGATSQQFITPLYLGGDIIYAAKDDAGNLCDLNADGRVFAGPQ